jgi:hypothetical protein
MTVFKTCENEWEDWIFIRKTKGLECEEEPNVISSSPVYLCNNTLNAANSTLKGVVFWCKDNCKMESEVASWISWRYSASTILGGIWKN